MIDAQSEADSPPSDDVPIVSIDTLFILAAQGPWLRTWSVIHGLYAAALIGYAFLVWVTFGSLETGHWLLIGIGCLPFACHCAYALLEWRAASAVRVREDGHTQQDLDLALGSLARLWTASLGIVGLSAVAGVLMSLVLGA